MLAAAVVPLNCSFESTNMLESTQKAASKLQEKAASIFMSQQLPAQQRMDKGTDMILTGQKAIGELGNIQGGLAKVASLLALFKAEVRLPHSRSLIREVPFGIPKCSGDSRRLHLYNLQLMLAASLRIACCSRHHSAPDWVSRCLVASCRNNSSLSRSWAPPPAELRHARPAPARELKCLDLERSSVELKTVTVFNQQRRLLMWPGVYGSPKLRDLSALPLWRRFCQPGANCWSTTTWRRDDVGEISTRRWGLHVIIQRRMWRCCGRWGRMQHICWYCRHWTARTMSKFSGNN